MDHNEKSKLNGAMENNDNLKHNVAIIGGGPAGLFAARQLALDGVNVVLFNRDIKPGGLAEYGIYPDKHRMKEGLRSQFRQILQLPGIEYYGNVTIGREGDLSLDDLRQMGFQAILVTVGAQGTKWLGLPGEDLKGVYHAKDLVYYYNRLPPYCEKDFAIGQRVAVVGAGNVSLDIAHYLICERKVEEVIAVVRRGPGEVKFDRRELEYVVENLDQEAFEIELRRVIPLMLSLGQDPVEVRSLVSSARKKAAQTFSESLFRLMFLVSPVQMIGDEAGRVIGLEVENNTLVQANEDTKARGLGTYQVLDVDTVIFAIGDQVDERFGLPTAWNEFIKNPAPRFPVEGASYEAFDPETGEPIEGTFIAGWSRKASTGLVGVARKDGTNGARSVLEYLQTLPPPKTNPLQAVRERLQNIAKPAVTQADLIQLEAIERLQAQQLGVEEYKFSTNQEMLEAIRSVVKE